ncbi:SDR family oxidoreductase [Paenibacillus sp. J22TS3]|uniref:SDR family oxidoreductase n=1 Tax=Paenibacillus sp. J22TS3 TaxID=2807192 RepID=UPI001B13B0F3|nr:SDR family oxidoreductase [Paenibacillus sp. J22TS3]GIP22297.1 NmrA family transcriptional regulator [Paenibacillus sp. J22TS3]
MLIVTGANGKLGRGVVEQLLKRIPAEQIGVSVRDVSQAQDLKERGVRVRHGDFAQAESLLNAFEGASQVLLVSTGILGDAGIRQHQTAIDTAKKSGATRVLYTSHMGSSSTSYFPPMVHHAATEDLLKESGMRHTSLRNGFYASSLVGLIGDAIKTGELIVPEDGPIAWTTHSDLAQATAVILTEKNWDGPSPNLTASEAIDMERVAAMVSDIVGRPIYRKVVTDEAYRVYLTAQGFPEARIAITLGLFRASRNGDFAPTSNALADLIGRPPLMLRDFLKESLPVDGL